MIKDVIQCTFKSKFVYYLAAITFEIIIGSKKDDIICIIILHSIIKRDKL
jgi:hypothetical protein